MTEPLTGNPDLGTRYLGLELRNPLVAAASPFSKTVDGVRRLADAGVGAVVLASLFEEQLLREAERDAALTRHSSQSYAESESYFPAGALADGGPRRHLSVIERAAAAVDVPVIASLNGVTPGSWARHARSLQEAGAAAIELNVYFLPGDPDLSGDDVERRHLDILAAVTDSVSVPVAVKVGPHFSAFADTARALEEAGADALVLFNRYQQPDIDPETLTVRAEATLSSPVEMRLPLTWIALLRRRAGLDLAATTGVEDFGDVVRYLLAGADVVQTASALLRHGPEYAGVLLDGLADWMRRKGFSDVGAVRGLLAAPADPADSTWVRGGYVQALETSDPAGFAVPAPDVR